MQEVPVQPKLSTRNYAIYRTVVDAGPGGISIEKIIEQCLKGEKKAGTIRSAVCYINKQISPQRLIGKGGRYYLENFNSDMGKTG